jgi:hypothetical protein
MFIFNIMSDVPSCSFFLWGCILQTVNFPVYGNSYSNQLGVFNKKSPGGVQRWTFKWKQERFLREVGIA